MRDNYTGVDSVRPIDHRGDLEAFKRRSPEYPTLDPVWNNDGYLAQVLAEIKSTGSFVSGIGFERPFRCGSDDPRHTVVFTSEDRAEELRAEDRVTEYWRRHRKLREQDQSETLPQ